MLGVRVVDVLSIFIDEDGSIQPLPPRPAWWCVWNRKKREWSDRRPIEQIKGGAWEVIKAKRSAIEFGPFEYKGTKFDGDADAQRRISVYARLGRAAQAAGTPFSVEWTAADNSIVTLSAADFEAMELVKDQQMAAAFAAAGLARAKIKAASSQEEIEKIKTDPIGKKAPALAKKKA